MSISECILSFPRYSETQLTKAALIYKAFFTSKSRTALTVWRQADENQSVVTGRAPQTAAVTVDQCDSKSPAHHELCMQMPFQKSWQGSVLVAHLWPVDRQLCSHRVCSEQRKLTRQRLPMQYWHCPGNEFLYCTCLLIKLMLIKSEGGKKTSFLLLGIVMGIGDRLPP